MAYDTLAVVLFGTAANGASGSSSSRVNSKRYLILTYAVEFDRVHYPLPLEHQDPNSSEALQRTVQRLRADLAAGQHSIGTAHHECTALLKYLLLAA